MKKLLVQKFKYNNFWTTKFHSHMKPKS